jgi:hypothetical protein
MKKGFYYLNTAVSTRCYYLTGEKKGNKWIELAGMNEVKVPVPNPEWWALNWMNLPNQDELKKTTYSETNPTNIPLPIK